MPQYRNNLWVILSLLCFWSPLFVQGQSDNPESQSDYHPWGKSLILIDSAIQAQEGTGNTLAMAGLWIDKGNLYAAQAKLDQSYDSYKHALLLYEKLDDHIGIGNCYINFGRLTNKIDKSIYYYRKAYQHFKIADNPRGIGRVLNNIGVVYEESEMLDSATYYFNLGLNLANENDLLEIESACLTNLGTVAIKQGNCEKALIILQTAESVFTQIDKQDGLAYTFGQKGLAYNCLKQPDSAFFYFQKQYHLAEFIGQKKEKLESIYSLQNLYEDQNNFKEALFWANKAIKLKEEIDASSTLVYADMLVLEMEALKKSRKLEQIQFQKRLRELWALGIGGTIFFILIIALLILYKLRSRIRKNKLIATQKEVITKANNEKYEQEIRYKNKELRQLSNYILQKRDFIELAKNELEQIKMLNLPHDAVKRLNQAMIIFNGQLNLSQDNETLQANMEEIQKNFFRQLKDKYPKLTQGDIKLLAFLSVNLSSKDIAQIMGISVESVHTKRYRLRKKLDLETNISFTEFLQQATS